MLKKQTAFTLIELMIVVAIIAILAAIAIPNFMASRDKAKRSSTIQSLDSLKKAMEMYLTSEDAFPPPSTNGTNKIVSDLTPYLGGNTNITSLFKAFDNQQIDFYTNAGKGFTIIAKSLDRNKTPLTITEETLLKPD